MEPTVEVTRYQVSCLPSDHPDAIHFTLTVERRDINPDRWAVLRSGFCYDTKGREKYEPIPSQPHRRFQTAIPAHPRGRPGTREKDRTHADRDGPHR